MTDPRCGARERTRMRNRLRAEGAPCHICKRPIDYDLGWYIDPRDGRSKKHPYSFEWDHDVPHSQGGDDSWENALPAHRICNQRKGDGKRRRRARNPAPTVETGDGTEPQGIGPSRNWREGPGGLFHGGGGTSRAHRPGTP